MARFIPDIKPDGFNNSVGEKEVYEALHSLNDKYTVFYSLSWVGGDRRSPLGEADFVIFHPEKGIVVIEVKSGGIDYKNGVWIQINTKTKTSKYISPFDQARKSMYALMDKLRTNIQNDPNIPMMCYAVWFTSIEWPDKYSLPPECAREFILDSNSLAVPEASLERVFDYWSKQYTKVSLNVAQSQRIVDVLCPHFHIVPKLKTRIEETEQQYIQLTRQQASVLDFMEEQDTAVIHGLAGTGKTVLAVEKARRLSKQGETVLFLCYNRFLRDSLQQDSPIPGVKFHNAHSLAYEIMGASESDDNTLNEFEEYLEIVFDADTWKYKNIVIDEGQDLDDSLLNRLYELVQLKRGCFYAFYDRNQLIMKNQSPQWIENAECRLVLHKNCRNSAEIFNVSCNMLGMHCSNEGDVHGEVPAVSFYKTQTEVEVIVNSFIKQMIDGGLHPEDIVVLTAKTEKDTWVSSKKKYGEYELSHEKEPGKILFTTIRKFKGLEAKAVLIVDASLLWLLDEENKRLLYVGASRARDILIIALLEDVQRSEYGDYLRQLAPDRNMPRNKKGFKRLLGFSETEYKPS